MNARLIQSQKRLQDSQFELYEQGGLELYLAGSRGLKRDLITELETSGLATGTGEIIRYRAINRWDEEDEFDEWARPVAALSPDAERIVGVTNQQLAACRPSELVLTEFVEFFARGPCLKSPRNSLASSSVTS